MAKFVFLREYSGPISHVLMVHLGGNNLGLIKGKTLIIQAKDNFEIIKRQWLGVILVSSAMIPEKVLEERHVP